MRLHFPLAGLVALLVLLASPRVAPSPSTPATASPPVPACPGFSIALVNGVPFHFEVLSGLLWVMQRYHRIMHVYVDPKVGWAPGWPSCLSNCTQAYPGGVVQGAGGASACLPACLLTAHPSQRAPSTPPPTCR